MTTRNDTLPVPERVENLLRDVEPFRSWLEDRRPAAVVGYARSDETCPLAHFLREVVNEDVFVSAEGVYLNKPAAYLLDERVAGLPRWARRFVRVVDGAVPQMPPFPVTADEARRLLEVALDE